MTDAMSSPFGTPMQMNHLLHRIFLLLLVLAAVQLASAQSVQADSAFVRHAASVYSVCERTAEPLIRTVFRYRAHLGMWPIEEEELRTFLAANSSTPPPVTWSPCSLSGDVDGCVIRVRIGEAHKGKYWLPDSTEVHRADARFYLIADAVPGAVRVTLTGELRSSEIVTPDGRMIVLSPFTPAGARVMQSPASAPDSVLFIY